VEVFHFSRLNPLGYFQAIFEDALIGIKNSHTDYGNRYGWGRLKYLRQKQKISDAL
jgi:hypothetical protein